MLQRQKLFLSHTDMIVKNSAHTHRQNMQRYTILTLSL